MFGQLVPVLMHQIVIEEKGRYYYKFNQRSGQPQVSHSRPQLIDVSKNYNVMSRVANLQHMCGYED